jgi:RimJ/RimL family protein N-acetyltransferase
LITRLTPDAYPRTRSLFADSSAYNVAIDSTLDGITPGTVWADDVQQPTTALISTVEGWALGGTPTEASVEVWARFLRDDLFTTDEGEELDLRISDAWQGHIDALATRIERETIRWPRRHYVCTTLALTDPASRLPDGFTMQRIDAAFLDRADSGDLKVPAHTIGWTENNWGTRENYLAHGFGFCTVDEAANEVVSWSVADCVSGFRCEIGIHTHPEYRRRGLASLTAAAAVEYALANGYSEVGWHCDEQNAGSISTAERVGFTLERKYESCVYMGDAGMHHTLRGYRFLTDGSPQASIEAYQQALALRDDYPYWVWVPLARAYAAVGDTDQALDALNRAADLGEPRASLLHESPEFAALIGHPAFDAAVERIRANADTASAT